MNFSLQQGSGSCLPFLAAIRVSIYRSRRHIIPRLIIFLQKEAKYLSEDQKCYLQVLDIVFKTHTHAFSGGFPKECWKLQRLVEVIEYFAASLDYFRLSHWFWRHSSGILCTFISEGRMFSKLERLDPTANKGKVYVITSNSFIFHMSNGSQDAVNLLATRSITRPTFLDLGGTRNSFWKW